MCHSLVARHPPSSLNPIPCPAGPWCIVRGTLLSEEDGSGGAPVSSSDELLLARQAKALCFSPAMVVDRCSMILAPLKYKRGGKGS